MPLVIASLIVAHSLIVAKVSLTTIKNVTGANRATRRVAPTGTTPPTAMNRIPLKNPYPTSFHMTRAEGGSEAPHSALA